MRTQYPLFQSHLDLAHRYWQLLVTSSDIIIDATCGNGHDTLFLAQLNPKKLYAQDIQQQAIEATQQRVQDARLSTEIIFRQGCHSTFPEEISTDSVKLIVYNLGYLPGGDKTLTTETATTRKSIERALTLIQEGGVISITCYPGHPEGLVEEREILQFTGTLDPKTWSCCHHQWINREKAPSLLLVQKSASRITLKPHYNTR